MITFLFKVCTSLYSSVRWIMYLNEKIKKYQNYIMMREQERAERATRERDKRYLPPYLKRSQDDTLDFSKSFILTAEN